MISSRILFFIILAVRGLDYVRADSPWSSPMNFNYMYNDVFDLNIILKNVPQMATHYTLFVQTENCDNNIKTNNKNYKKQESQCNVSAKNGPIITDEAINLIQKLNKPSVMVSIQLRNSNEVCSTKRIMTAVRDMHADKVENKFRTACIKNYDNPCEITVDFEDKCEDSTPPERNNSQETRSSSTSLSTTPQAPKKTITSGLESEVEKPQDQQHIEAQTNPDQPQDPTSYKTKYYIGIASVAGIIILISLIYVVIKKCYRKSSDEQTLQLETYASTNMVLYAELDIRPGNAPPPARTEDPTYAKIIGVLRPQNKNVKK